MSELDDLLNKMLEQKPEMAKAELEDKIRQKKDKIGAGYLTDQGALFLIAADLGVSLTETQKTEISLKDLYAGAKDVVLEAGVLSIAPVKQFTRKDGSPLHLRTVIVYDADATASVKLWDANANLPVFETMKPGDIIKIKKAYIKADLDGTPAINVGTGAGIEVIETASKDIPSIDSIAKDVSELKEGDQDIVVSGVNDGLIAEMKFTTAKGQPGKALKMRLKGKDGTAVLRVVLWGKDESSIPNIVSSEAKVRLLGVRVKAVQQGIEIHGNEGTVIEIEGKKDVEPVIARVLSITPTQNNKSMILAVDEKKNLMTVADLSNAIASLCVEGDVIECMPTKIYGNSITLDENSFVRKLEDGDNNALPRVGELRTKIESVDTDTICCVEAIVLKISDRREIQTKSGESVALSEMLVEDDTGQIWVRGWRDQAREVDQCQLGEIISITGINARQGFEGKTELTLSVFSKITKKN